MLRLQGVLKLPLSKRLYILFMPALCQLVKFDPTLCNDSSGSSNVTRILTELLSDIVLSLPHAHNTFLFRKLPLTGGGVSLWNLLRERVFTALHPPLTQEERVQAWITNMSKFGRPHPLLTFGSCRVTRLKGSLTKRKSSALIFMAISVMFAPAVLILPWLASHYIVLWKQLGSKLRK